MSQEGTGTAPKYAVDDNSAEAIAWRAAQAAETAGESTGTVSPAGGDTLLGFSPQQIVTFLGMVAGAVIPGASLIGLSIGQLTDLGVGIANEVPEAVDAFKEIQAVASSGLPPTADDWAKWNAAADAANTAAAAAEDAVIAGKKA